MIFLLGQPYTIICVFSSNILQLSLGHTTCMVFVFRKRTSVPKAKSSFMLSLMFCDMTKIFSAPSGTVAWSTEVAPCKIFQRLEFIEILSRHLNMKTLLLHVNNPSSRFPVKINFNLLYYYFFIFEVLSL